MKMEAIDSSRIFVSFNRATIRRTVNTMGFKHGLNAQYEMVVNYKGTSPTLPTGWGKPG